MSGGGEVRVCVCVCGGGGGGGQGGACVRGRVGMVVVN